MQAALNDRRPKVLLHGDDRLMSKVAAELGGISEWTVNAWLTKGHLRRTKVGGRTLLRKSELERFVADGDGGKSVFHRWDKRNVTATGRSRP
jgi:excisionase family DNA binding protein